MNDIEKADQIIEALRKLDDREQALFLFSLLGVLKVDSPRSICLLYTSDAADE